MPVEVDTARLETSRTDTVKELLGSPVQNCPSGSFLFWRGPVGRGRIVYDIVWMGRPRRKPWTILRTPVCFLSYQRLSSQSQHLVYLSQWLATLSPFGSCRPALAWRSCARPGSGRRGAVEAGAGPPAGQLWAAGGAPAAAPFWKRQQILGSDKRSFNEHTCAKNNRQYTHTSWFLGWLSLKCNKKEE